VLKEDRVAPRPGGWLGLLCRILIFWQPLMLGLVASGALRSLAVRGWPLAAVLVGRMAVAAFGIAAGLALWRRAPSGLTLVRASTPYMPNNRPPGDTTLILAASLVWYGVWLVYLWRSPQVRNLR